MKSLHGLQTELKWKTDWMPSDNYAENQTCELERLLANYKLLHNWLVEKGGCAAEYVDIETKGWETYPFADMLNTIEKNMNELRIFNSSAWIDKDAMWLPGRQAPDYGDINRWERNGRLTEQAIRYIEEGWRYCGTFYSGQEVILP